MKKIVSILLLIALLCMTSICFAENNVELYTNKLQGTWTAKYYNGGMLGDTLTVVGSNSWFISGDETGEVFITFLLANPVNVSNSVCYSYRITFSADGNTLVMFDGIGNICGIYTK